MCANCRKRPPSIRLDHRQPPPVFVSRPPIPLVEPSQGLRAESLRRLLEDIETRPLKEQTT